MSHGRRGSTVVNTKALAAKYGFTDEETENFVNVFTNMDGNGDGFVDFFELKSILNKDLKMNKSDNDVRKLIAEVDSNKNETIELDEFFQLLSNMRGKDDEKGEGFASVVKAASKLFQVQGHSGLHSYAQDEVSAFSEHFNHYLGADTDLKHLVPVEPEGQDLLNKVNDGLLLAKFINIAVKDTIDERALNKRKEKPLTLFQITENQNIVISSAKSIGCNVVNTGATELINGEKFPHIVLGIVWQLVKIHLLNSINLKNHPELIRLLEDGESLSDLLKLPPDQLLLRWFNYHLKNAGHPRRVKNFGGDVADSECYTVLLNQIAPQTCDRSALSDTDHTVRAGKVLKNAGKLNVKAIIKPKDIVKGNPKLNLAFTAAIFNQCPGLDPLTEEEMEKAGLMDDDVGDSREERAFRMWINSLGIDGVYINNLFEDCKDGLALLKVMDQVEPGIVPWKNVEQNSDKLKRKFSRLGNTNLVVVLGKQMKFSMVNIGGEDIEGGNKKLLLGFVWQLMRHHTLKFLKEVQSKKFGNKNVDEKDIVEWANSAVKSAGRSTSMSGFKDPSLCSGLFFMDLLFSVESRIINWDFVTPGDTDENKLQNAKYAISVARKLGAVVFLLPEDIVEVKPKMILTFVASIMSISK